MAALPSSNPQGSLYGVNWNPTRIDFTVPDASPQLRAAQLQAAQLQNANALGDTLVRRPIEIAKEYGQYENDQQAREAAAKVRPHATAADIAAADYKTGTFNEAENTRQKTQEDRQNKAVDTASSEATGASETRQTMDDAAAATARLSALKNVDLARVPTSEKNLSDATTGSLQSSLTLKNLQKNQGKAADILQNSTDTALSESSTGKTKARVADTVASTTEDAAIREQVAKTYGAAAAAKVDAVLQETRAANAGSIATPAVEAEIGEKNLNAAILSGQGAGQLPVGGKGGAAFFVPPSFRPSAAPTPGNFVEKAPVTPAAAPSAIPAGLRIGPKGTYVNPDGTDAVAPAPVSSEAAPPPVTGDPVGKLADGTLVHESGGQFSDASGRPLNLVPTGQTDTWVPGDNATVGHLASGVAVFKGKTTGALVDYSGNVLGKAPATAAPATAAPATAAPATAAPATAAPATLPQQSVFNTRLEYDPAKEAKDRAASNDVRGANDQLFSTVVDFAHHAYDKNGNPVNTQPLWGTSAGSAADNVLAMFGYSDAQQRQMLTKDQNQLTAAVTKTFPGRLLASEFALSKLSTPGAILSPETSAELTLSMGKSASLASSAVQFSHALSQAPQYARVPLETLQEQGELLAEAASGGGQKITKVPLTAGNKVDYKTIEQTLPRDAAVLRETVLNPAYYTQGARGLSALPQVVQSKVGGMFKTAEDVTQRGGALVSFDRNTPFQVKRAPGGGLLKDSSGNAVVLINAPMAKQMMNTASVLTPPTATPRTPIAQPAPNNAY